MKNLSALIKIMQNLPSSLFVLENRHPQPPSTDYGILSIFFDFAIRTLNLIEDSTSYEFNQKLNMTVTLIDIARGKKDYMAIYTFRLSDLEVFNHNNLIKLARETGEKIINESLTDPLDGQDSKFAILKYLRIHALNKSIEPTTPNLEY